MGTLAKVVATTALAFSVQYANATSFGDAASLWLSENVNDSEQFNVEFSQQKVAFKGCNQREYSLSVSRQITPVLQLEGLLYYGKGVSGEGIHNQTVSSKGYEVISWWKVNDYRFGIGHKALSVHDIRVPMSEPVALPTSKAISLHAEIPGFSDSHRLTMAVVKETWEASEAHFTRSWESAQEHQLQLHYSIAF